MAPRERYARTDAEALPAGVVGLVLAPGSGAVLYGFAEVALLLGVTMVLPIGGADMPVAIALIVAGMLVSSSGGILTRLMADAKDRSVAAVLIGAFGTGDSTSAGATRDPRRYARSPRTTSRCSSPSRARSSSCWDTGLPRPGTNRGIRQRC
ncbi:NAD(P)(+) transhydrogenase (Re/Si-specific) subunit beta [Streptomyces sp. NPDC059786]|uniref:NAD(P)(+) transhydrogenase (Re/Si-specific) subunit beta n=1 Tax=Streptomyces sp. NPDC059786 TaxID=3346946 RepID=UPI0036653946